MTFEEENDTIFAIEQNVFYKGKYHDELMWAEIKKVGAYWELRWEDSYQEFRSFNLLEHAKHYVLVHKHEHSPHVNGYSYD